MVSKLLAWLADSTLPLIFCLFAFVAGYVRGEHVASLDHEARISALKADWAEREKARAEAVAATERQAREQLKIAVARGENLARELAAKTADLDAERASITRRLKDVAEKARRDCAGLSPEWVRLYNAALGLAGAGDSAGNGDPASGGTDDAAGATGAARAGIQPDALATPADVLAHVRDYGLYCRQLEAGFRAAVAFSTASSGDADVAGSVD